MSGDAVEPDVSTLDDSATAWMREGKGRPVDVTLFHEVAEVWCEDGYSVTPLYPAARTLTNGGENGR